jgi:hypothetical protein
MASQMCVAPTANAVSIHRAGACVAWSQGMIARR